MTVWKSPVLYFGILLVLAIAGLLSAPYVIDWNQYRADLESYGKKITGRAVKIEGPISVQLFPWPKLSAGKVSIANPPGLETPQFAQAERIVVRVTLAGLARGALDVQSVDVESPVIRFERLATGEGNWQFTPTADLVRSDILARVSLDSIRLRDGMVHFADRRRGEAFRLDDFNASVTSPGVSGPWRMNALALHDDRQFSIGVSTGVWTQDEPFRVGLTVAAADNSGLVFSFDGASDGRKAEGQLRIAPAETDDGKSDAEGKVRPLVFRSKVAATFDQIDLQSIEIAPQDPKQGGTITTGSAFLKLGRHMEARVDLSATMLDLDAIAGAQSRTLLREAGSLALAESLLRLLPPDMSLGGSVNVTALKTGGETLDSVKLELEADSNALRVKEFSTGLPGHSKMLFKGVYFPGLQGAEIAGELALESNDLRKLLQWLWPDAAEQITAVWTGSRGRFKLQTDVSVTTHRLRLAKAQYELDAERGTAELSVSPAGRGAVDLRIDANRVELDSYMPQGVSAISAAASQGLGGLAALILPHADAPDLRLTVQSAELLLNGVTATDVLLDLAAGANGLDLRALEIGSVGGARLEVTGLILDSGKGADGSIGLDVKAQDPHELLRLLGLIKGGTYPGWAANLGPLAIKGNLGVKPAGKGAILTFGLDGTAGALSFNGSGTISPQMDISGEAVVEAQSSGPLAALIGLTPAGSDEQAARLEIKAAGTASDGVMADAALQAFGARLDYRGTFNPLSPGFGIDGKLALRSTDVSHLAAASGVPLAAGPQGVLVVDSGLSGSEKGWALPDLSGRLDGKTFSGKLEFDPKFKFTGEFSPDSITMRDVLAPVFLGWSGLAADLESSFAAGLPFGLLGEIWIRPKTLQIHDNFAVRGAEIGIAATPGEISLALFGKDETGRGAQIEVHSLGTGASRKLTGRVTIPVDLSTQLLQVNGAKVAEGNGAIDIKFNGEGRSAGGVLAGLLGSGAYGFDNLRLLGLSPADFGKALAEAKDAAGITAAFEALRGGEGLEFGRITGAITIANGAVSFLPFELKTPEADVTVRTIAELALGEIDVNVAVALKVRNDLPAMSLFYAGPPSALARGEDNSEISTRLGVSIMQQGIDELERLQEEQKRLAEKEEKQRIEDEARLQAYYAQRDELLLRKREIKVHSEMRVVEAERLREKIENARSANAGISKDELKQRVREIRVYRQLARASASATRQKRSKPKPPQPAPPKPVQLPTQEGPLVLANPPGAPVLITPSPFESPSQ